MPWTKIRKAVYLQSSLTIITFRNEAGELHKDRGAARITIDHYETKYEYYRNGQFYCPVKKGRTLPTVIRKNNFDSRIVCMWYNAEGESIPHDGGQKPSGFVLLNEEYRLLYTSGAYYHIKSDIIIVKLWNPADVGGEPGYIRTVKFRQEQSYGKVIINNSAAPIICPIEEVKGASLAASLPTFYKPSELPRSYFEQLDELARKYIVW